MFVYLSLYSQSNFDSTSPFPSISTFTHLSPALITAHVDCCVSFSADFPHALVTPSILQTSTNQSPFIAPSTDSGSILAYVHQSKPAAHPSGPPKSASNRFLVFLLPAYVASLIQPDLLIRRSCNSYLPLLTPFSTLGSPPSSLNPTEVQVCTVTSWVKLCPSAPVHCGLSLFGALWFLTIYVVAPGCSTLLAVLLRMHSPQLIQKFLEGVLPAWPVCFHSL